MQIRIAVRTSDGPLMGDMIHVPGVLAFCRRTFSFDDVRHFSRSDLYRSDEWSPWTGGSYGDEHPLIVSRSCARGLKVFDYGRSKQGTGSYAFKKNWGFRTQAAPLRILSLQAGCRPAK